MFDFCTMTMTMTIKTYKISLAIDAIVPMDNKIQNYIFLELGAGKGGLAALAAKVGIISILSDMPSSLESCEIYRNQTYGCDVVMVDIGAFNNTQDRLQPSPSETNI